MNSNTEALLRVNRHEPNVMNYHLQCAKLAQDPQDHETRLDVVFYLLQFGALEEAEAEFETWAEGTRLQQSDERTATHCIVKGLLARYRNQLDQSSSWFLVAARTSKEARYHMAWNILLQANYEEGLDLYVESLKTHDFPQYVRDADLSYHSSGKALYVYCDNATDLEVIVFARFISYMAAQSTRVIFHVKNSMFFLMEKTFTHYRNLTVVTNDTLQLVNMEDIGAKISVLALPWFAQIRNNSYLIMNSNYLSHWSCYGKEKEKITIGIDCGFQNGEMSLMDTLPPEWVNYLVNKTPQYSWVSLDPQADTGLEYLLDGTETYYERFKKLQSVYIAVGVDSVNLHMVGAMGIPTAVLLTPSGGHWCLSDTKCASLQERMYRKTNWYKHGYVFRQESLNDWKTVVDNLIQFLEDWFNPNKTSASQDVFKTTKSSQAWSISVDDLPF